MKDTVTLDRAFLELQLEALDAAWQDLKDWTHTARGLRERSKHPKGPDYDNVPHQRGIDQSEKVIERVGLASTALRTMLDNEDESHG